MLARRSQLSLASCHPYPLSYYVTVKAVSALGNDRTQGYLAWGIGGEPTDAPCSGTITRERIIVSSPLPSGDPPPLNPGTKPSLENLTADPQRVVADYDFSPRVPPAPRDIAVISCMCYHSSNSNSYCEHVPCTALYCTYPPYPPFHTRD